MNISCVICSDLFIPTAEVYITQCGHMFHFACLINWIERYNIHYLHDILSSVYILHINMILNSIICRDFATHTNIQLNNICSSTMHLEKVVKIYYSSQNYIRQFSMIVCKIKDQPTSHWNKKVDRFDQKINYSQYLNEFLDQKLAPTADVNQQKKQFIGYILTWQTLKDSQMMWARYWINLKMYNFRCP